MNRGYFSQLNQGECALSMTSYNHTVLKREVRREWAGTKVSPMPPAPENRAMGRNPIDAFTYITETTRSSDVGVATTDIPFPTDIFVGYFEMACTCGGRENAIAIGLICRDSPRNKQPGWTSDTFGYHGDDGRIFNYSGSGTPWGPKYTKGDVVGCGYIPSSGDVFFTVNGEHIGDAFKGKATGRYCPAIGLHSNGEAVEVNLGVRPFVFDIDTFLLDLMQKHSLAVRQTQLPQLTPLVKQYMFHTGAVRSLRAWGDQCDEKTSQRAAVIDQIKAGDAAVAMAALSGRARSLAASQTFAELVGQGAVGQAISLGVTSLGALTDAELEAHGACLLGIAPEEEGASVLERVETGEARRKAVSRAVNAELLEGEPSVLETLIRQCQQVHSGRTAAEHGRLPRFSWSDCLAEEG
ncbi:SPRY domain [Carpediemonas membranifera]|uniref:SPRY domain n=1 Tax=Carpediemonas membranifera TaxID=201153 RepID=A0A8J6B2J4_9EUKA|nr:SPRY domain [Carpediemonas membranifera]|eukprot:KAG9397035.1 SPRY domain [Carpediemonas membranifera]